MPARPVPEKDQDSLEFWIRVDSKSRGKRPSLKRKLGILRIGAMHDPLDNFQWQRHVPATHHLEMEPPFFQVLLL